MSDTLPEEPQTNAIDTQEAPEGSSDESNVGLHTSMATFQLPMMSTPKFERYVPLSKFESLCEKVSLLSAEIKLLKEKKNSTEQKRPCVSYITAGTQTDEALVCVRSFEDEKPSPKSNQQSRGHSNVDITSNSTLTSGSQSETAVKLQTNNNIDASGSSSQSKSFLKSKTHNNSAMVSGSRSKNVSKTGGKKRPPVTHEQENAETSTDKRTDTTQKSTLIIGSSITQRIRRRGLKKNTMVRTMRGAGVADIRSEIALMNLSGVSEIILQVGGNDVSRKRDLEVIAEDFAEIIADVTYRSPCTEVLISEVTPRKSKKGENIDMSGINRVIKNVCEMYGATLIESTRAIQSVNERQFWSNVHLSDAGTRDLLFAYEQYVPILKSTRSTWGCTYCGEEGHNSRKCKHGGKIVCYACSETGHKAKHCSAA